MNKVWRVLDPAPQSFLQEHPELPSLVANLLYHRNLRTQEQIDEFLNPDYLQDIHDPFLFKHMEKACKRTLKAIEKQEKIVVHGDYDADGVSSSVILISVLKKLGAEHVDVFLPHREIDGYGLNKFTVQMLAEQKTDLIITCDCGISNGPEVKLAKDAGIDVIITDHHTVPDELPPAYAIIHPLVPGELYPDKGLAGGGVAFKLAQGLLRQAEAGTAYPAKGGPASGWEKWFLDMVAIASVADMVPLLGESRTLTKYGLIVLNKTKRIGLQKLLLEARLLTEDGTKKREFDSYTIGFQIAPRINAAGRMNHANAAYNLLMTEDPEEAAQLAHELDQSNQERQKMTEELVKRAIEQIEPAQINNPILIVYGDNWPPGIIGLISGKIKDKYYKPTLAMTKNENEMIGSGRSIEGFSLIGCLQSMPEFFTKFGGHPMACGFSLKDANTLPDLKKKMIEKFLIDTAGMDVSPKLDIDAEIELDKIDWDLYDLLSKFEPFGQNNEKPKYLTRDLIVQSVEPVGQDGKHIRIMASNNAKCVKKFVGWNLCNGNNGSNWCKNLSKGDKIDVVFEISVNEWNGNRELQLTIADLQRSCDTDTRINTDVADNADKIETDENGLIYSDLTYKINGVLFETHNKLGRYLNEKQICDAVELGLKNVNLKYEREKILPPCFDGEMKGRNRVDFLIEDKIILEIKTLKFVGKEEYYQCLRYLESLNLKLCILANFRDKHLRPKRILNPKAKI